VLDNEMERYVESIVKSCCLDDLESDASSINSDGQTFIISEVINENITPQVEDRNRKSKLSPLLKDEYKSDYRHIRTNIYYKLISHFQSNKRNIGQKTSTGVSTTNTPNKVFANSIFSAENNKNVSFSAKNSPHPKYNNHHVMFNEEEQEKINNYSLFSTPNYNKIGKPPLPRMNIIHLN